MNPGNLTKWVAILVVSLPAVVHLLSDVPAGHWWPDPCRQKLYRAPK